MTRAHCQMLARALPGIVVAMSRLAVAAEQDSPPEAPSSEAFASDTAALDARASDTAASEDHANVDVARLHFRRGVNLYRAGAYDAAFAEFTRAYESAPNHRILYNLAQVQAERHDYVEALGFFRRYLDEGAESVPAERADEVRSEIAELEQRISRLRVEINVDDAHLFVDGLPGGDLPRDEPLLLNAGVHRLSVQKVGFVSASRLLTLVGGEESTVDLELIAELDIDDLALPAPAPPAPAQLRADRTALWTSLAATGALAGASVTFGLLTRRANATLDDELSRFPAQRASVEAGRTRVRTFALLTDGFGAAAAAALGLSTYLFFSTPAASDEPRATNGLRAQIGPRASSVVWLGDF
jgi:tetratricopeptide (TPR) repeat protein